MRRNYLLILFALLLLGGCKKDSEAFKSGIGESSPTFDVRVTSASISGMYRYRSDLKSVTVVYDKNSDFSSASTIPAEIHNCKDAYNYYYHVRLPDLEPGTTYYYYCIFDTGYGSAEGKQWSFTTYSGGGRFSVSSTTKVEFAPGNLYWDGSAFRFEENQWSFSSTWNASHVSHFKWSDAANAVTGDHTYSGDLFCNNNFTVAGDSHTWRTLSKAEWNYLLNSRDNASSLRVWKELDGGTHKGLVILPDGMDASVMSSISSTSDLATYGAVFLPAAGYRDGADVSFVGWRGYYWSSTPHEWYNDGYAYVMDFNSGDVNSYRDNRYYGIAVRLVVR